VFHEFWCFDVVVVVGLLLCVMLCVVGEDWGDCCVIVVVSADFK